MKTLDYAIPFNGFSHLDLLSCLAGIHTYLTRDAIPDARPNAWDYHTSPRAMQEDWYFTLGTMTGQNAYLDRFDGAPSRPDQLDSLDFCMGFLGYAYRVVTGSAIAEAAASIDRGYPAIAVLRGSHDCRVVIGYTDDGLVYAPPKGAQGDTADPTPDMLEQVIVITGTELPRFTLVDGLRNIERVLNAMLENVWPEQRSHFPGTWGPWAAAYRDRPAETKAAFHRLMQLMWNFDHCHNVSSTFAHKIYLPLCDDRLADLCREIDAAYAKSHDMQWALQALHDLRDWEKTEWCSKEFGMFLFADIGLSCLEKEDRCVLSAVRRMLDVLESA